MNLLGAKLYDPAVAVSKATSSLLAMTAFDTTNLRLAITVPAHGMVLFKIHGGGITGATTVPTIFLGAMNGATILGRIAPHDFPGTMNVATQTSPLMAEFVATGLTPGAMNVDLAYGVEVIVSSTSIKYGGPNDTTTANAWGGIAFEAWDPQPMETTFAADYTAARAAKLDDLDATVSSRSTYAGGAVASVTGNVGGNVVGSVASVTADVGITQAAADKVWSTTSRSLTTFGTLVADIWASATRTLTAFSDSSGVTTLLSRVTGLLPLASDYTSARAAKLDDLDAAVSSRLASASYTAPDNTDIVAIKAKTDNLPTAPADETLIIAATDAVMARLGTPAGVSVSADIAAVQAKTTHLPASPAATSDIPSASANATAVLNAATAAPIAADIQTVKGGALKGDGSPSNPWNPA